MKKYFYLVLAIIILGLVIYLPHETRQIKDPSTEPITKAFPKIESPPQPKILAKSVGGDRPEGQVFFALLQKLPTIEEARKLSIGDSQQMPASLIATIEPLLKVNRMVKENPQLEPEALHFYESCSLQENLMNAVRARCLTHLRRLAQKRGEGVDLSRYSTHLVGLSDFINL